MKIENNCIVMEHVGFPGSIGDSAAETGRYQTIATLAPFFLPLPLDQFVTDKGILRHPDSPWREDDTSSDQVAPLLVAACLNNQKLALKILDHLKSYRTGNGDLVTPGLYATMRRAQRKDFLWLSDLFILGQALLMKLPYRWSDSKKWFESMEGSSADYLNFSNFMFFAYQDRSMTWPLRMAMDIIPRHEVMAKVEHYYRIEPNSSWMLDLYRIALNKVWS